MRAGVAIRITSIVAGLALVPPVAYGQTARDVLAEFADEPTVREVQEATAAYNHIDQGEISGWTTRVNISALLPRVRVDYRRRADDDLQTDFDRDFDVLVDGSEILTDIARDVRDEDDDQEEWRIQGNWELNELIFNPDVLRVSNEASDLVELREDLLTTVTTLYFERRRAQVQIILDPPTDAVERLRRELEIEELTAGIDTLTGGWFSGRLSAAGRAAY